ncbi:MAG: UDP-4-amino-4,6-dideoxy-N-acetyl-beta-L-altrosamine transaminase [Candidatus Lambdaproteobacteria bacterium]|nr:UDP-4-amino-4,6-dideoxy-N-acetyl-beta-L-altrosamine transaminase [Candidatus Lambdaproteobacteria bacterium]
MIPYGRQNLNQADLDAVLDVLRSDWLTQGPANERFERAVATYCGAPHAVAVCNATAALHLACCALELGPGDALWTSPNTFVASANCALYCGAGVDFVDIDPRTYNLSAEALAEKLAQAERGGRLPKVVVPVHFGGQPCELEAIARLARRYGFRVIEDAAHAIGARYRGEPIGAGNHSDLSVFSFHPVKIVTSGEGGMVLTRHAALHERVALLRSHGITRAPAQMTGESEGGWYYQQVALGYNYRMTDMQAALGASQMTRIEEFLKRRHALAERYDRALAELPVQVPWRAPERYSAFHLYVIRLRLKEIGRSRAEVYEAMRRAGIGVNVHYIPVHLQPHFRKLGFKPGDYPEAEAYYAQALTLPLHAGLTEPEQDRVVAVLRDAVR